MTANDYTYDVLLNNESIFKDSSVAMIYILINYDLNSIPMVEIKISTTNPGKYLKTGDYVIKLSSDQYSWNFSFNSAIYDIIYDDRYLVFYGYLCTYEQLTKIDSSYLGDGLTTAIDALEIRDKIESVDNVPGDYWRFNDTKINTLLKLLNAGKPNSVFLIDDKSIRMIDMSISPNPTDLKYRFDEVTYLRTSNYVDDDSMIKKYTDDNNSYTITWNDRSFIGFDYSEFMENLVTSLKYKLKLAKCIRLRFSNIIDTNLGDFIKIGAPLIYNGGMYVLNKTYTFTPLKCVTDLVLGIGGTE